MVDKTEIIYDLIFNTQAASQDIASLNVQLKTVQDNFTKAGASGTSAAATLNKTGKAFGSTGQSIQNASYQVADFFTQIQGGISPVRAVSQQLPQLLAGFGAIGAAVGAGVAIFGPYVASLIDIDRLFKSTAQSADDTADAFSKAAESAGKANQSTLSLAKEFGSLNDAVYIANQQIAELDKNAALKALGATIDSLAAKFAVVTYEYDEFAQTFDRISIGLDGAAVVDKIGGISQGLKISREEATRLDKALSDIKNNSNLDQAGQVLTEIAQKLADGDEESQKLARSLFSAVEQIAKLNNELRQTPVGTFTIVADQIARLDKMVGDLSGRVKTANADLAALTLSDSLKVSGASASEIARQVTIQQEYLKVQQAGLIITPQLKAEIEALANIKAQEAAITESAAAREKAATQARAEATKALQATKAEYDKFVTSIERGVTPIQRTEASIRTLQEQFAQFGAELTPDQVEAYYSSLDELNQKLDELTFKERWDEMAKGITSAKDAMAPFQEMIKTVGQGIQDSLVNGLTDAFMSFIDGTKSAEDAFKQFAVTFLEEITAMIIKALLLYAIQQAIGMVAGSNGFGSLMQQFGGIYGKGGVFSGGREVKKFANGGIVNSPTVFPMSSGTGLMGESGPEAIVPLTRRNGKLGVEASPVNVTVINNSSASVSTSRTADGGLQIAVEEAVANAISRGGSKIDRAMTAGYGLRRAGR